jgi:hypothetical protein
LDCRHVCKTCAFHDALQAVKQKEVHPLYSPDVAPAGATSGEYGEHYTSLHDPTLICYTNGCLCSNVLLMMDMVMDRNM